MSLETPRIMLLIFISLLILSHPLSSRFRAASAFNADVSGWDVQKGRDFTRM